MTTCSLKMLALTDTSFQLSMAAKSWINKNIHQWFKSIVFLINISFNSLPFPLFFKAFTELKKHISLMMVIEKLGSGREE